MTTSDRMMIELTASECELWEKAGLASTGRRTDHDALRSTIEPAYRLARSLLDRKAVPAIRMRYFVDPILNASHRSKSRMQLFESNGTSGDAILRDGNFHKYLRYWIVGPELSSEIIEEYSEVARSRGTVTSGDGQTFTRLAREQTRRFQLNPRKASEEYFKLCLELDVGVDVAFTVRNSVMQMR